MEMIPEGGNRMERSRCNSVGLSALVREVRKPNVDTVKAAIVFETMFGTTRLLADAVAKGLSVAATGANPAIAAQLVNVNRAARLDLAEIDLLIVGAPTHAHGLSTVASRGEAAAWPNDPNKHVTLDDDAAGIGMREWLDTATTVPPYFAAFDSRWSHARILTGAASVHLSEILVRRGSRPIVPDESFLISDDLLVTGEAYRAEIWGERLVGAAIAAINRPPLTQRDYTQRNHTQHG